MRRPDPVADPTERKPIEQNRPDIWGPNSVTMQQVREKEKVIMDHMRNLDPKEGAEEWKQSRKNLAYKLYELNQKHIAQFEEQRDKTSTPEAREGYQKMIDERKDYNPFRDLGFNAPPDAREWNP
jgi:hypothetical protein